MTEQVSIDYDLGQYGWSQFRLTVGGASAEVGQFGYCTDALGDLVRAALAIATGAHRAEVSFDAEPMEWRLIVGPDWDEPQADFRLRVLTFRELGYPPAPEGEGGKIFEAPCSPDAFVDAVLKAGQSIWDTYGADGYDKAWGGLRGFPLRALSALKTAVAIQEPRVGWLSPGGGTPVRPSDS